MDCPLPRRLHDQNNCIAQDQSRDSLQLLAIDTDRPSEFSFYFFKRHAMTLLTFLFLVPRCLFGALPPPAVLGCLHPRKEISQSMDPRCRSEWTSDFRGWMQSLQRGSLEEQSHRHVLFLFQKIFMTIFQTLCSLENNRIVCTAQNMNSDCGV